MTTSDTHDSGHEAQWHAHPKENWVICACEDGVHFSNDWVANTKARTRDFIANRSEEAQRIRRDAILAARAQAGLALAPGVQLIAAERQRQVDEEGYTPAHDFDHEQGQQLARAAVCYAVPPEFRSAKHHNDGSWTPLEWPWEPQFWKPTPNDRIRELVKAGALIAAEIDRLTAGRTAAAE